MPDEAEIIHGALFPGMAMPDGLKTRYAQARERFFAGDDAAKLVDYIVAHRLDAEAIEFALRLRRGPNGLTRRFLVMSTLCEVRGEYQARFVQHRSHRWVAWAAAPLLPLRAAWKLLKGLVFLRTHRLRGLIGV